MSEKMKEEISAMMDDESSMFGVRRVLAEVECDEELHVTWERYHFVKAALNQSNLCKTSMSNRVWAELENEQTNAPEDLKIPGQLSDTLVKPKLNQYVSSMAVAATVAFMTVFGWQQYQGLQGHGLNTGSEFPLAGYVQENVVVSDSAVVTNTTVTETMVTKAIDQKPFLDASDTLMLSDMPYSGIQTASSSASSVQGPAMVRQNLLRPPTSNIDGLTLEKLNLYLSNHAEHAALNTGRGMLPFARTANYPLVEGAGK